MVIEQFTAFFTCTTGQAWCKGYQSTDLRRSLHEVMVDQSLSAYLNHFSVQTEHYPIQEQLHQPVDIHSPQIQAQSSVKQEKHANVVSEQCSEEFTKVTLHTYNSTRQQSVPNVVSHKAKSHMPVATKEISFGQVNLNAESPFISNECSSTLEKSKSLYSQKSSTARQSLSQDLVQVVNQVFEEFYDPKKVKNVCAAREQSPDYDFKSPNLHIATIAPQ